MLSRSAHHTHNICTRKYSLYFPASRFVSWLVLAAIIISNFSWVTPASAAINKQINYQGKLTDSSNVAVANAGYNMRFKLYTAATGGSPIWTETWCYSPDAGATCNGTGSDSRITVSNGLFSTLLGSTTSMASVDFNQTLYLGVEIGSTGTTPTWDGEMTPRKKLGAVPAAIESDRVDGISSEQFFRSDAANSTTSSSVFASFTNLGAGNILDLFGTGSASRFTVQSGGNIGIGTTSPYAKLSVAGTVVADRFFATSTTANSVFAGSVSVGTSTPGANDLFVVGTSSPSLSVSKITGKATFPEGGFTSSSFSLGGYNTGWSSPGGYRMDAVIGGTQLATFDNRGGSNPTLGVYGNFMATNIWLGSSDAGITRDAAGVLRVTNGLSGAGGSLKAEYFTATSSTFSSIFPNASTTNLTIAGKLYDSANSSGTNGMVLQTTGSATNWVATSSLGFASASQIGSGTTGQFPYYAANGTSLTATSSVLLASSGNIGIGTTSPFSRLSVVDTSSNTYFAVQPTVNNAVINFGGTANTQFNMINNNPAGTNAFNFIQSGVAIGAFGINSAGTYFSGGNSSTMTIGVANSSTLALSNGGNSPITLSNNNREAMRIGGLNSMVGVGMSPDNNAMLDVGAPAWLGGPRTTDFFTIEAANTATSTTNAIAKRGLSISSTGAWTGTNATNTGLYIGTVSGGTTNYDAIFNGGNNVGIGTDAPTQKLQIVGGNTMLDQSRYHYFVDTNWGLGVEPAAGGALVTGYGMVFKAGGNAGQGWIFKDHSGNTELELSSVTNNLYLPDGNIGIGTSSPYARLSVAGDIVTSRLFATSTGTSTISGGLQTSTLSVSSTTASSTFANGINLAGGCFAVNGVCVGGSSGSGTVNTGTTGQLAYYAANGTAVTATSSIFLASNGNFGVGTSSPFSRLSVTGNAYIAGNLTATGTLAVTGTTTVGALNVTGTSTLGTLNGPLQAVNGLVTATSTLSVAYGGTGLSTTPGSGQVLFGNGTGYSLVATSSLGINSSPWTRVINDIYFSSGKVGIGTDAPTRTLDVVGTGKFVNGVEIGRPTFYSPSPQNGSSGYMAGDTYSYRAYAYKTVDAVRYYSVDFDEAFGTISTNGDEIGINYMLPPGAEGVRTFLNYNGTGYVNYRDGGSFTDDLNGWDAGTEEFDAVPKAEPYSFFGSYDDGTTKWSAYGSSHAYFGGNVGIGTTSPYAKLAVTGTVIAERYVATSTATSTFEGGLRTALLNITGPATSTFANGINLAAGCFSVAGVCIGSTGGSGTVNSGTTGQFPFYAAGGTVLTATSSLFMSSNGNIGIGTTTPYARFSVEGSSALGNSALAGYFQATSTIIASIFPNASTTNLTIAGKLYDSANSSGTNGMVLQTTGSATNWVATSSLGFASASQIGSGTTGQFPYYASSGTTFTATSSLFIGSNGNIGIGTTSPYARLSVEGSSALGSSALAGFFTATSTNATSTFAGGFRGPGTGSLGISALTNGFVGVGTLSPTATIHAINTSAAQSVIIAQGPSRSSSALAQISVRDGSGYETFGMYAAAGGGGLDGYGLMTLGNNVPSGTNDRLMEISPKNTSNGYRLGSIIGQLDGAIDKGSFEFYTGSGGGAFIHNMTMKSTGRNGLSGVTNPTAKLHIEAGSTAANSAPLKFNTGSLLSTAEAGAFEFLSDKIYFTITTGAARKEITLNDSALSSGRVPFVTTNGRLADTAAFAWDNTNNRLGIGTSTPYVKLGVAGDVVADRYFATSTGTSTFVGGLQTALLNVTGVSTSTFANGINLTTGCFSVNGTCVGGAGGGGSGTVNSGTTGQFAYYDANGTAVTATSTLFVTTGSNVGVGTSTPYSKLSVWGGGTGTNRVFEITNGASTTLASFLENGTGYFLGSIGIATTTVGNGAVLGVGGSLYVAGTTTASTTKSNFFTDDRRTTALNDLYETRVYGRFTQYNSQVATTTPHAPTTYYLATSTTNISASITSNNSGATYYPKNNSIMFVNNSNFIYEFSLEGDLLRTITMANFLDTEALNWMYDDTFVVGDENGAGRIVIVQIPQGSTTINRAMGTTIDVSSFTGTNNNSMEGVAYDSDRDVFYIIQEHNGSNVAPKVGQVTRDGTITTLFTASTVWATLGLGDISDVYYDRNTQHLFFAVDQCASQANGGVGCDQIVETTLSGQVVDRIYPPVGFNQVEGIGFSPDGENMFITSEPDMYAWYKYQGTQGRLATRAIGNASTTPWNFGVGGTTSPSATLSVQNNNPTSLYSFIVASGTAPQLVVNSAGNVGVGTSSPYAKLSVEGDIVGSRIFATSTGTSTFAGGFQTALLNVTGVSTSTFANGINITTGCFSVNGVCVGGAGGGGSGTVNSGTTGQFPYYAANGTAVTATSSLYIDVSGDIGVGTSSIYSRFSVWGFGTGTGQLFSLVNNASTTVMQVLDNGNIGIGTTSPYAALAVVGEIVARNITASSTTATSTISGGLVVNGGAISHDLSTGITSIDNLSFGAMSFDTNAGVVSLIDLPVTSSATAGTVESYSAQIDGIQLLTVYAESDGAGSIRNQRIGIGSSTPYAALAVSGDVYARNYVATSTTATSTFAGLVGIGTTTPWRTFSASGTVAFFGLTTEVSSQSAVCITAAGELQVNTGAQTCTISSGRFKHDIKDLNSGISEIMRMRPVSYIYNDTTEERVGFVAEELVHVDPRFVFTEKDGTPRGVRYEEITSLLTKAMQEQQIQINELRAQIASSTFSLGSSQGSLASFMATAFTSVKEWMFDTVKAKKVQVEDGITIKDRATGEYYCIVVDAGQMTNLPGKCADAGIVTDSLDSGNGNGTSTGGGSTTTATSTDDSDNSDDAESDTSTTTDQVGDDSESGNDGEEGNANDQTDNGDDVENNTDSGAVVENSDETGEDSDAGSGEDSSGTTDGGDSGSDNGNATP